MSDLVVFNTLTDRKETFVPLVPGKVGMYVCGPTVYDYSHVGHARVYVAFDVVARWLREKGFALTYVRNFTDVDDKIIKRAQERGEDPLALAARFADAYLEDMRALGVADADVSPKVSEHIPEIVSLIEKLVARGVAYPADGDVYFAVRRFPSYAKLSRRKLDELLAGARVEPGEKKKDPLDFALWKAAKPGEPSWDSPWGKGRPGWHIECSAMSAKYLGETFDIHAGGKDLIFPHHDNEIAQSEAASGKPLARYWMHNGFVTIDQEKMSKSLGNFFTIREVLARYDAETLRTFLLNTHYRNPIDFSDAALAQTDKRVEYHYETLRKVEERIGPYDPGAHPDAPACAAFEEAMDDDFNTAAALGALAEPLAWMNEIAERPGKGAAREENLRRLGRARASVLRAARVLGLMQRPPAQALLERRAKAATVRGIDEARVESLIAQRNEARRTRDFTRADALRAELLALGVEIMDTPAGTTWRVALP